MDFEWNETTKLNGTIKIIINLNIVVLLRENKLYLYIKGSESAGWIF